ncbi:hypothetical protein Cni_G25682 [Canna indica]|uniref:HD-Zip IV C-terminal domain-containing protein n=1 Tax=Canna indica TaxID=4628 RepID=A0AAQ3KY33_9LILI|nr:hypothetical protein Cni_G25682 [Canna indica]
MLRTFCANVYATGVQSWTALSVSSDDTIRVMTRKNTELGQPNGVILMAVSTTWLPFSHQLVFELLTYEQRRSQLQPHTIILQLDFAANRGIRFHHLSSQKKRLRFHAVRCQKKFVPVLTHFIGHILHQLILELEAGGVERRVELVGVEVGGEAERELVRPHSKLEFPRELVRGRHIVLASVADLGEESLEKGVGHGEPPLKVSGESFATGKVASGGVKLMEEGDRIPCVNPRTAGRPCSSACRPRHTSRAHASSTPCSPRG